MPIPATMAAQINDTLVTQCMCGHYRDAAMNTFSLFDQSISAEQANMGCRGRPISRSSWRDPLCPLKRRPISPRSPHGPQQKYTGQGQDRARDCIHQHVHRQADRHQRSTKKDHTDRTNNPHHKAPPVFKRISKAIASTTTLLQPRSLGRSLVLPKRSSDMLWFSHSMR